MVVGFLSIMIDLVDLLQVISEISDPPFTRFPTARFPKNSADAVVPHRQGYAQRGKETSRLKLKLKWFLLKAKVSGTWFEQDPQRQANAIAICILQGNLSGFS